MEGKVYKVLSRWSYFIVMLCFYWLTAVSGGMKIWIKETYSHVYSGRSPFLCECLERRGKDWGIVWIVWMVCVNCVNCVTCVNGFVWIMWIVWLASKTPQYFSEKRLNWLWFVWFVWIVWLVCVNCVICVNCVNSKSPFPLNCWLTQNQWSSCTAKNFTHYYEVLLRVWYLCTNIIA